MCVRAGLFTLECGYEFPGDLVKLWILIQQVCGGGAEILHFLTDSQTMLMLLVHEHTLNDNKMGNTYCAHFTDKETEVQ